MNEGFESKFRRIKVPIISLKEITGGGKEDSSGINGKDNGTSELPKEVEDDRRFSIEAAVVRVMKSRKTATHNELVAEVIKQLAHRFKCMPTSIKRCIESLIEREYLCRDGDDRNRYNYLA